jgi:hypothetical protein
MAACLHQRIAGVDYVVSVPPGVSAQALDGIRAEFASRQPPAGDGIRVDLVVREMPDPSSWRILLSSGPAWAIRQRGAERCLCLGEPVDCPPAGLVACWRGDASRATVYCGLEYFAQQPDGVELRYSAGYPVDQLLFMYYLARRHGLLLHAAGLAAAGRALIFPGVSGAGKSTLAQQFLMRGTSGLLSDDRIIVREMEGRHVAFGTPWPGDAGVAVSDGAPLGAILFPAKGADTCMRELSSQAALDRLLPAASMLWHEQELLTSQLETCERLLGSVPAFELSWSPGAAVVDAVQDFMRHM